MVVVYESLWGNTAAVADAIAEGLGPEAKVLSTAQATAEELAGADLVVAGGPVFGFQLSSERTRQSIQDSAGHFGRPCLAAVFHRHGDAL